MESNQKLELIDQAIQKLLAEKRSKGDSSPDNDHLLLSNLLSELELSKSKPLVEQEKDVDAEAGLKNEKPVDENSAEIGTEEIVKELREVKKQNFVTHCLLSALIVLTLTWQVSEVSLILKLKDGVTHPFRCLGGMLFGVFRVSGIHEQDAEKPPPNGQHSSTLHLPELPHVDLGMHNGEKK